MIVSPTTPTACQARPLYFALNRTFHKNPNYSSGTYAKQRAGTESRVLAGMRELPGIMSIAKSLMGSPLIREMSGELMAGHPEHWVRPRSRGRIHLPWESMAAARSWLARFARFKRWIRIAFARQRGPRWIANALGNARARTREAIETTPPASKEAMTARLRRWAVEKGVPWGSDGA